MRKETLSIIGGVILVKGEPGQLGPNVTQGKAAIVSDSVRGINEGDRLFFATTACTPVLFRNTQYYAVCVGDIIGKIE